MNEKRLLKRALTRSELKKLVQTAENKRDKALISFCFLTGGRIGEVVQAVKLEDIQTIKEEEEPYIQVAMKTEKNPDEPVRFPSWPTYDPFWPFVEYWRKCQEVLGEKYLFTISARRAYQIIREVGEQANILVKSKRKDEEELYTLYPHIFRHSRCTDLVANWGLSAEQLKEYMGWSSTRPYDTYSHLRAEDYRPRTRDLRVRKRDL